MKIRQERPTDYDKVYELLKISFATVSHNDGTEQDYLNELRKKDTFIPELSFVVENDDGKIIGQIVLYKTNITTSNGELTELLLSPISVHPNFFRKGIARAMIEKSFSEAKKLGYKAVFVCGDSKIYKKFGFKPSYEYNIYHILDDSKEAEWSMVYELVERALNDISGIVNTV